MVTSSVVETIWGGGGGGKKSIKENELNTKNRGRLDEKYYYEYVNGKRI